MAGRDKEMIYTDDVDTISICSEMSETHSNCSEMSETHSVDNNEHSKHELFTISANTPDTVDDCINEALAKSTDLFSFGNLVRGQPPRKRQKIVDLKPVVFVRFNSRMGKAKPVTLKCLLDTGATASLVDIKHAKKLRHKKLPGTKTVWTTPGGNLSTTHRAQCTFLIPEFHTDRIIEWDLHMSSSLGAYDMIIGRDILKDLGFKFDFQTDSVEWDGATVPMKDTSLEEKESYHVSDPSTIADATERLKAILDAKYEKADLAEVAEETKHLSTDEKRKLRGLLEEYADLFDGTLGTWNMDPYEVELRDDATPYHARAFPIPRIHQEALRTEVDRLCESGVLKKVNRSEWAAPTFIIPKKDGSVRFISDFRELNKRIKRKPYPIPKIQDMLLKLEGFQYATSLDLNMGYYHIELTPHSKSLCTIVLPWGKYEYQRLPMGLSNSPDIFQEKMSTLMSDLEYVRAYIDDLLVITNGTYDDHLEKLAEVLKRLREAGLKVNAKKSFFGQPEVEYLGYWITRDGIQPVTGKINAIANIAPPKTKKELRKFIGIVNYYRDMWVRRSHVLAPLASLTSKTTKWKWEAEHQKAFDDMKRIISKETLLAYPDFNEEFVIHTDASHYQLGAVISQRGKPIAFYSRKLKPEQTRYTTTERELLSIVETLKEFRNILLGQRIVVHTDHKNLTCKNFNTERVMRWRLVLEEYSPELRYIKGEQNIVADALSRLDLLDEKDQVTEQMSTKDIADLFAGEIGIDFPNNFPLSYREIEHRQKDDAEIKKLRKKDPNVYVETVYPCGDKQYTLITKNDKIVIPKALQKRAVEWYHEALMHPGKNRTELTIGQHFCWKGLHNDVEAVLNRCQQCQLYKPASKKLGLLPPKESEDIPWERLCIDLIGPYTIGKPKKGSKGTMDYSDVTTLHCLTMIDPATGWFEICRIPAKTADEVINVLQQTWLNRYPRPMEVIMDRGSEFAAEVRDTLVNEYGVVRKLITTRNPQANSMVERAHQTVHTMIATHNITSKSVLDTYGGWEGILGALGFAMRSTVHTTMRATPAQLVFGRDAIHNIRFEADWQFIKERRQHVIQQNNKQENAKRKPHTYSIGDTVKVLQHKQRKHGEPLYKGPYDVVAVNDNGTLRLRSTTPHGGATYQTWNLRNVHPYQA